MNPQRMVDIGQKTSDLYCKKGYAAAVAYNESLADSLERLLASTVLLACSSVALQETSNTLRESRQSISRTTDWTPEQILAREG